MLQTQEFLAAIWPGTGLYCLEVLAPGSTIVTRRWAADVGQATQLIAALDAQGCTVYHACAAYTTAENRKQTNVRAAKAFWIDIDVEPGVEGKYESQTAAMEGLAAFCNTHGFPIPMVICSGGGFHCYWTLQTEITALQWNTIARRFKAVLAAAGVKQDNTRTADIASILRPVGSHHRKGAPRQVFCLRESQPIEVGAFENLVERAAKNLKVADVKPKIQTDFNSKFAIQQDFPSSSGRKVAEKCAQIAKLLATEYARLNKAVGSPRAVQLAAKEAAERTVDRQPVRLARPEKATAAAARAGKAAEKAHAAGNLDEAAGFKRNQILNTAIARAQRELRTFVDKAQGDFAKMFGKDDQRAKTRDMNLVNLARAALAQYRMGPEGGAMKALRYLNLVADYDPPLAANLESMLNAMPEGKDYRDLTAGEFRTVANIVRGMWEMSRGVKQITIDGKKVEIDAAADELVAAVMANNGGEQGNLPGYSGTTTTADDLRVGALGIKSMLTRVEQWADYMGPAFKRFIWQPVSEAVTRYRVRRNEMVKQYRDLLKTIEPDLTFHKIHAPELGLGGFTFNAGKSEVLHAILHSGNKSNLRKLLLGRGWATVDAEGELDTSRWDSFVERMVDEGVITRNDMDFVQGVWDLLETVKGDAQKAHRELYGAYAISQAFSLFPMNSEIRRTA